MYELGEVRWVGETGGLGSIVWRKDQMGAEKAGVFSDKSRKDMVSGAWRDEGMCARVEHDRPS